MDTHQPGQRGAELPVITFLQMPGVRERHTEILGDEFAHSRIDLSEQIALGRIERVVEVENPNLGRAERLTRRHWIAHKIWRNGRTRLG